MTPYERFSQHLRYDPETGKFFWKTNRAAHVKAGDEAGSLDSKGYIIIRFDRRAHKAHRIAWLLTYGKWPTSILNHKNRVRNNNRIENLEESNYSVNQANTDKKFKGVYFNDGRYSSSIMHKGIKYFLGNFDTAELARASYERKYKELKYGDT